MSSPHLNKRLKKSQRVDPPEFHVRSGPRPDPNPQSTTSSWPVVMACRIALQIFHLSLALWTLARASISRSWIFILECAYFRNIPLSISQDRARLTKIPHHLAIIVSKERSWINRSVSQWDAIIQDICNTCVWSSELGIREISVFEPSGYLKRRSTLVQKQLSKAFEDWQLSVAKLNGTASQPTSSKGFKLSIFAEEDGKAHVGQVARQMAVAVTEEGRFTSDDINVQLVDKWMAESLSEPELALVCYGTAHHYIELNGFFPWHMRLTEFINIPSYKSLSYPLFIQVMCRYSNVEQRFGR